MTRRSIIEKTAYPQENFAEHYEFKQSRSVRSPIHSKWEEDHIKNDEHFGKVHKPMEYRLVNGNAHGYGHSIGQRHGKLRTSGHPGAHRIGKR